MRIEPEKRLIKVDKDPDVLKISKAVTVESGNLTLTTGDLVLTAGDVTQTGDQAITGNLVVTGNISGTGDITRTGDSAITGDITGTGALTRTGDSTITGDILGTGDITRVGNLTLTGSDGVSIAPASADPGVESVYKVKQILFSCAGGATETITAAIPAHAFVLGVQGKIKVTVTGTTIATFLLGITGDTNRFGNFAALTKNTAVDPSEVQAEAGAGGRFYAAATDILLTANAGTFDAVGVVALSITYIDMSPPTDYA